MKKLVLSIIAAATMVAGANAQNKWSVDASHSSVNFNITHMMVSDVDGNFKKFSGDVTAKDDSFQDAMINFTVDVASVNTNDDDRDKHLKSDDFFSADKFPNMTFKGSSFKKVSGNKYQLKGNLTIKDITKPVVFDVTFGGIAKDPWGNTKAGFKSSTIIKRSDYNLTWNKTLDAGGVVLSDEVKIIMNVELKKN